MDSRDRDVLTGLLVEANRALIELPESGSQPPERVEYPPAVQAAWHTYAKLLQQTQADAVPAEMRVGVRGVLERLRSRLKGFAEPAH